MNNLYKFIIASLTFCFIYSQPALITFAKKIHGRSGPLETKAYQQIKKAFNPILFIETGTYNGETSRKASLLFKHVYTVELSNYYYHQARQQSSEQENISFSNMKSKDFLPIVLKKTSEKRLFWLDAHCSLGKTEGGSVDEVLTEELEVLKSDYFNEHDVILIDDLREILNGKVQELMHDFKESHPNFTCHCLGDILCLYSAKHYPKVKFSLISSACTDSLLNHFKTDDASINKLIQSEKVLFDPNYSRLSQEEIDIAINSLEIWNGTNCGFYLLWQGLLNLKANNHKIAVKHLFNANKILNHPRINAYLVKALLIKNKVAQVKATSNFQSKLSYEQIQLIFSENELNSLKKLHII